MPAPIGNTNNPGWPDEHVVALRKYFADGLSHQQIADQINLDFPGAGYSRNASIGKCNRLGLTDRPATAGARERLGAAQKRRYARESAEGRSPLQKATSLSAAAPARPSCAEVDPQNMTLLDLAPHNCRWPVGGFPDAAPVTFCGQIKCSEHESYCHAHWQLSIGPGTASERRAA
jgi:GcrA cell cycle regulator